MASSTHKIKPEKKPETKKENRLLPVPLTEEEFSQLGKDLAECERLKTELEIQFKAIKDDWSDRIDEQEIRIKRISRTINAGFETRPVECELTFNTPKEGQKTIVRLDSKEEVEVCDMNDSEKQRMLDFEKGKEAALNE